MCFKRHQTHKYDYLLVFLWRNKYSSTSKNTFSYIKPGLIKKIYYFDLVCIFLGTELFKLNSFLKILLYLPNIPKTFIIFFISYGGYGDLAARRKNATRESTATLKAWLNEHKKNPYPTKGEKIMLAIITKMTLTQVIFSLIPQKKITKVTICPVN